MHDSRFKTYSLLNCKFNFALIIFFIVKVLGSDEFRNGRAPDWELKPRFTTSYNSVPTHE